MIEKMTLINQGWTVFLLVLIYYLFREWWPASWLALANWRGSGKLGRVDLIVLAIMVSHIGFFLDNFYWLVTWSCVYLGLDAGSVLLKYGVYANTVFRQGFGVAGVLLHLYAAVYDGENEVLKDAIRRARAALRPAIAAALVWAVIFTLALFGLSFLF